MSVIRVGSTNMYAEGWDAIFGRGTKPSASAASKKKGGAVAKKKTKSPATKARRRK